MNGKEYMIKAHVIKVVILSYFWILIRVTVKFEGRTKTETEGFCLCVHTAKRRRKCVFFIATNH